MAYTTIEKIKELGFDEHMFDASDFDAFLARELTEAIQLIEIQYEGYHTADSRSQIILANAERYLTAANLERILAAQSNSDAYLELAGQAPSNENKYKTAQQYENKAYQWLAKLGVSKSLANESGGIASSVVVS